MTEHAHKPGIVIVGAGHGGVELAAALRLEGYDGALTLIDASASLPYQRPPLSKEGMMADEPEPLPLRGEQFYAQERIELRLGSPVTALDAEAQLVELADRTRIPYQQLVLAMGLPARRLHCAGEQLAGVHILRSDADAAALHAHVRRAKRVTVIGSGFIGMEFASVAADRGCEVTVISRSETVMRRSVSSQISQWFTEAHRARGVRIIPESMAIEIIGSGSDAAAPAEIDHVSAVLTCDGERIPTDLAVIGIGVDATLDWVAQAGIAVADGVVVDPKLTTSIPNIYALGDIAVLPGREHRPTARIESVQNATDQARHLAKLLTGHDQPYRSLPWFWSIQCGAKLQIAGLWQHGDESVTIGDPEAGKFSVLHFRDSQLSCVESVNAPADHIFARKILAPDTEPPHRSALQADAAKLRQAFV